jgi:NAD(P)-dependent dehydrogenase (short-subunit alcohol dehydrogenase family)
MDNHGSPLAVDTKRQGDPRFHQLICWTKKQHTSATTQPLLAPSRNKLSSSWSVCIIGASTGIGEHIAYAYVSAGVGKILICSRTAGDLLLVKENIRRLSPTTQIDTATVDISRTESVAALAQLVMSSWGHLDVLVLNAGWANPNATMGEAEPRDVQRAFEVNAIGTYNVSFHFTPVLLSSNGAKLFLAVSSGAAAGRRKLDQNPGYAISKLAQIRMIEYMMETHSSKGLTSIALQPGTVATRMSKSRLDEKYQYCKNQALPEYNSTDLFSVE